MGALPPQVTNSPELRDPPAVPAPLWRHWRHSARWRCRQRGVGDRKEERRRFLVAPSCDSAGAEPIPNPGPMETEPEPEAEPEPHPEPGPAAPASPPCPAAAEGEGEDEDEDEDFQFLRCDGCGQDSAQPRLLRCLHTLCPGCLSDTKQCPRCQAATGAPAVDNLLFCNLRSRLQLWRQIRSSGGPGCSRCRAEAALVWCSDCEEFFCGRCLEEHQWWHKKKAHRVRRVEELRAGSARQFLEDTRGSCSLFCSSDSHPEESRVCRWERMPSLKWGRGTKPHPGPKSCPGPKPRPVPKSCPSPKSCPIPKPRAVFQSCPVSKSHPIPKSHLVPKPRPIPTNLTLIYCPRCERALCCPCALLDTRHAPFRDLRAESRRRQDELRSLRRDLRRLRRSFEAALGRLRGEAARREEQRERLRERVRASAERLQELVRSEAEELRALLEARPERGRSALAEELSGAEGALLRLEAAERLVERLGRYGGEQELMDMQPFVKAALLELRRLRPPEPPELREPPDFAECRARLRALVERVTGRPDVPEVEVGLENNLEEDPTHPKPRSISPSLEEIHVEEVRSLCPNQPLPLPCWKRPLPSMERGSQVSPKLLKLECDHEPGPSHPKSQWEFPTEPGPSTSRHNCVRASDTEGGSIIICSSDDSDEDTVVVTVTPEPPPC
ncbi:protein PML [Melozone crissalis]|uniref:protein PML n=1 Tax=Melozone crissalis TaxID=40204 RepID=UPI0023DCDF68|nr:protein PML [Melozone crissalis]